MIDEDEFEAGALQQFLRAWRNWRKDNPDAEVVYVYVGHPDMAAAIVRQSPLWQRFAEWEKRGGPNDFSQLGGKYHSTMKFVPPCDCAACTASRATREESKAYDA